MSLLLTLFVSIAFANTPVAIGSKAFTEGYLMGELAAQTLELEGFKVEKKIRFRRNGYSLSGITKRRD